MRDGTLITMRRNLLILSLFLLLAPFSSWKAAASPAAFNLAPGAHLRFEHLTIEDGLSQNAGLVMLQDRQGYLWIGSQDGLNRYDGYGITQFKHDPENSASLSYNSIISLYEDAGGFLWVGTWGGGLNRLDPKTGRFTRYESNPTNPASLDNPVITDILSDGQDGFWVGTLGGLNRVKPGEGVVARYHHDPADAVSLSSDAISVIVPAEDGKLWIGTGAFSIPGAGLNLFDPQTGQSKRFAPQGDCLQSPNISDILPDPQGNLWIAYGGYGVNGGGIDRYHPGTGACKHYDNVQDFGDQIIDDNFADLMFDQEGGLWAASWSSGVWHLPQGSEEQFTGIHHNPADPDSLSNDNTFSLLQDRSGVIWIGTLSAGINKLNPGSLQFRTYRNEAGDPGSLPSNHVGAFAETSDGAMWVGTWENGLARFDPLTGNFTSYRHDSEDSKSISSDLVMSLLGAPDGSLWVGTLGSGLNHLDVASGVFTRYQNDPANAASVLDDRITALLIDGEARLWVASMAGLSRLDPIAKTFINYPLDAPVVDLELIGDTLWIGTWGAGVARLDLKDADGLDPEKAQFSYLANNPTDVNSLSENSVFTIHAAADGVVWLGTQGGLNRYDPKTGNFKRYTEKHGLRNATIMGILEDPKGFLWITTNNGLVKFNPQSEEFRVYDVEDGLQGNEFNSNGYFLASSGEMYVGGVSGFSVFNPEQLSDNSPPPNVVITKFSIFNTPQVADLAGSEPIELNYDQNFISFEFAALDFQAPGKNQFMYKLEGVDKDWIRSGTRNYASYTNLRGGDYTFRVMAANGDGVWSTSGASLPIKVIPPFWETWIFGVGLVTGLALLVLAAFQWRVRAVRKQNAQLQAVVAEQQRVEEELRESEARIRAIFDNAGMGISIVSSEGRVLDVNPKLEQLAGRSAEELRALGGRAITYPDDQEVGLAEFKEVLAGTRDQYQVEKRYVHKNGQVHWMRQSASAVRDSDGKLLYLITIAEDIDERKRAVEELRESEARFRAMFNSAAVGVAVMTLDRRIIQINQRATELTGYSLEELADIDPAGLAMEEDRYVDRELFVQLAEGRRSQYTVEKRYIRKGGQMFWGRVNFSAVRGDDGKPLYLIGSIEDITEEKISAEKLAAQEAEYRHLLEQRIAERTEELNLANERLRDKAALDAVTAERTRLARDLHDAVTQTLFSTTLIADVLPDIWEMNVAEGKRRLEELRLLTRGALAEMRTLLVELRPNALVEVPLPTLLRQLVEALSGRAKVKIELNADVDPAGGRKLPADVQVGLYRIAQEALNNVVKHAGASEAVVTLRMGDVVRLTVADNGKGFDPSAVTADHLGLKIMRERAETIGAKLSVYSEPGEGTQISAVWEEKVESI